MQFFINYLNLWVIIKSLLMMTHCHILILGQGWSSLGQNVKVGILLMWHNKYFNLEFGFLCLPDMS